MTSMLSDSVPSSPARTASSDNPTFGESPSALGRITYELTSDDYNAAARTMFIDGSRIFAALFTAMFLFIYITSVLILYRTSRHPSAEIFYDQFQSILTPISTIFGFYALYYYILIPLNTKRLLRGSEMLTQPWICEWTSDAIMLSNARGSTTYFWADFLRVRDTKDTFLLFYSKYCYLILPKRAFASDAERTALERLLQLKNVPLNRVSRVVKVEAPTTSNPSASVPPLPRQEDDSESAMADDRSPTIGQLRYELTSQDYNAAARSVFMARSRFLAITWGAIIAFIYLKSIAGSYYSGQRSVVKMMYGALSDIVPAIPGCIILYLLLYYFVIPWNTKRSLKGSSILAQPWICDWGLDGLTLSNGRGITKYFWTDFVKIQDSASALLLYYAKQSFLILPKRAFATEADREAFESLIKAKMINR